MSKRSPARALSPHLFGGAAAAAALALLVAAPAVAEDLAEATETATESATAPAELTGLEIARRSDKVSRSQSEHQVLEMTLENSRGQTRERTIEGWSREVTDEEEHRFSRFLEPSDVKDTSLLTYDYDDADDDIWLYLPALKKVKRILSSNKTDYFMGSDFTYEDMENLDLKNWDYTLEGSEVIDGIDCHKVRAVPNNEQEVDESGYSQTLSYIGKEDFVSRRVEYTDKKGRASKVLALADIRPVGSESPRPRAHKLTMDNAITRHKTVLRLEKLEIDVKTPDDVFSQRNLRQ